MDFDQWFDRQFGKRPSSVPPIRQAQAIKEARDRLDDMISIQEQSDEWDWKNYAARIAWKAAGGKES